MTDLPKGEWSPLLVGLHWPGSTTVTSTSASGRSRAGIEQFFQDYSNLLRGARTGPLGPMEGVTADATRGSFQEGEKQASSVAEKNSAKAKAYGIAAGALEGFRSDLRQIAADGNSDIQTISNSKKTQVQKIGEIVNVIADKQAYGAHKGIQWGGKIVDAIQTVLTAQGDSRTPEQFAADNGISLEPPEVPSKETVRPLVEKWFQDGPKTPPAADPGPPNVGALGNDGADAGTKDFGNHSNSGQAQPVLPGALGGNARPAGPPPAAIPASPPQPSLPSPLGQNAVPDQNPFTNAAYGQQAIPAGPGTATTAASSVQLPSAPSAPSLPHAPSAPSVPSAPAPSLPSAPAFGPEQFANSFHHGMQSGAPLSAGTEALSHNALNAAFHPAVSQQADFAPAPSHYSGSTTPTAGHVGYETAHAAESTYAAPADNNATTYAAPTAAPMAPSAVPPIGPAGPLPTYGSDLRPPTPTIAAPTPPPASAAGVPTSAPSSGAGALNQQPLVRQQPVAAQPAVTSVTGISETALAATTSGALVGAAAEEAAARSRLRSLVEAVARQDPKLRWAVGERADGNTVLITDLAHGWIPPHVEIPTGVKVLTPAQRRGGLEDLLGAVALVETWSPGQYLPAAKDAEPVAMSIRSRGLPSVDDLNWEITQATNWRDGLPRLAHTLAKAGIAGTGVLDSEGELLREHLRVISDQVRNSYPGSVDFAAVGNWQLLAAIDALVSSRKTSMNYHFAWFQQLQMATQGGRK